MGSRLGVIVLAESGPELYYDHWAAQTVGLDIALDGFEATLARVRSMTPMGVDTPAQWHGATWIEGSLLIDLIQRHVVWAEESSYLYLPRIVNHLIEKTWPGWSAVWSPEGVRGTLWLTGVDPATIFTENSYSQRTVEDLTWFVPWAEGGTCDALSVRLDSEQVIAWRGEGSLDFIAQLGPDLIRSVAVEALARSGAGEPVLWDSERCNEGPATGIHLDFTTKTARWWAICDDDRQIDAFDGLWPGWSVETVGDAYEFHEHATGKPMRSWAEEIGTVRDTVQRMLSNGPRENPLLRVASLMADQGEQITINAAALKFEPASDFSGAPRAIAALDELDAVRPLTPARFVNRHGQVFEPSPSGRWPGP
ncbi:hypothetical protein [Mycobacterium sp. DL99]|uniref:hypothetical protein n=1 Tax=Mycobacterium sp. DL99 TaxID=2528957 RepID=UPI00108087E8|nr:hypothetical protein [Mycobacterium sp. DL99]